MISSTYQYFSTLDDLNPTIRDTSFSTPSNNKQLNSVNNNDLLDTMANRKSLKEECAPLPVRPNTINPTKFPDTSLSSSPEFLRTESPSRRNSICEIKGTGRSEELNRGIIASNHHSIDLSMHSRSSEINNCKENDLKIDGFKLYNSKQIEKINSHFMAVPPHVKPEEKRISEKDVSSFSPPLLSQASNIVSMPFNDSHINASFPHVFGRLVSISLYSVHIFITTNNT